MNNKIYGLCLQSDGRIRYIGQTSRDLSKRLIEHKWASTTDSELPVMRWIRKHDDVIITLLEEYAEYDVSEIKWIKFFRSINNDMLNVLDGGQGIPLGYKHTQCTKDRMSKPKSEVTKLKMSVAQIGNHKSQGEHNRTAVLNSTDILVIRDMVSRGISLSNVAKEFNVQKAAIWKIKEKRTWKHIA